MYMVFAIVVALTATLAPSAMACGPTICWRAPLPAIACEAQGVGDTQGAYLSAPCVPGVSCPSGGAWVVRAEFTGGAVQADDVEVIMYCGQAPPVTSCSSDGAGATDCPQAGDSRVGLPDCKYKVVAAGGATWKVRCHWVNV